MDSINNLTQPTKGVAMTTKEKAAKPARPSKKIIMREIAARTDLFNFNALERTSIQNLQVILHLLDKAEANS